MRRIALFSDVHGNVPALDAVLADIAASAAAGEVYCLGDLVGYGPDPAGVIARIRDAGIPTVRGNYDEGIGHSRGECGCYYATPQARLDGAASYEFTDTALGDVDREWLTTLLDEIRLEEAGACVLLAHGSPRKINEYLLPDRTDEQLARLADAAEADVVCVGHIHVPYHRVLDGASGPVHYVSSGSAGKPKDGDPRASWVELLLGQEDEVRAAAPDDGSVAQAGASGVWVGTVIHRIPYDVESVARAMLDAGLPPTLAEALRRG